MSCPMDIKRAIKEQLYAHKFDYQVEMDQFLEKHILKLTQLEIYNLNMPISNKAIESTMNNLTGYPTAAGSHCAPDPAPAPGLLPGLLLGLQTQHRAPLGQRTVKEEP